MNRTNITKRNKFKFDYDSEEDILYMHSPKIKSKGSIEFGELVIDIERGAA